MTSHQSPFHHKATSHLLAIPFQNTRACARNVSPAVGNPNRVPALLIRLAQYSRTKKKKAVCYPPCAPGLASYKPCSTSPACQSPHFLPRARALCFMVDDPGSPGRPQPGPSTHLTVHYALPDYALSTHCRTTASCKGPPSTSKATLACLEPRPPPVPGIPGPTALHLASSPHS